MKKPSLTDALAVKAPPEPAAEPPAAPSNRRAHPRINTTLRLEPETLRELKFLAAEKRVRVNDLVLEGIAHVLALHGRKSAA